MTTAPKPTVVTLAGEFDLTEAAAVFDNRADREYVEGILRRAIAAEREACAQRIEEYVCSRIRTEDIATLADFVRFRKR